ncbi:hypothetical protein AB3U99_05665 [Niallia sp. JL1B1071]|uniref:hypothetical protein n=1 Tax=Niallia tiangongensis TaxID=3237105 RepID=UPI0037DDAA3B
MKHLLTLSFLVVFGSLFFATNVGAEEPSTSSFKEEVNSIYVEIPYDEDEVIVEKTEIPSDKEEIVRVYDADTKNLLEEYSVEENPVFKAKSIVSKAAAKDDNYSSYTVKKAVKENVGSIINTLYADLWVYTTGSFRQINSNSVDDTYWRAGSESHTLQDKIARTNLKQTSGQLLV